MRAFDITASSAVSLTCLGRMDCGVFLGPHVLQTVIKTKFAYLVLS